MKQLRKMLLLTAIFLFMFFVPTMAAADVQDSLVPQGVKKHIGDVKLLYNEYPQSHYTLDTYFEDTGSSWWPGNWDDKIKQSITANFVLMIDGAWTINVTLSYFTGLIVQEAFSLDFVGDVIDQIAQAIQGIAGFDGNFKAHGLWPQLVTFMIVLLGTWATYVGMIKRETSRAFGGLISAMIVFALSLGFFANAGTILKGFNHWSGQLQKDVLNISASVITPGESYSADEGIATIRNQVFQIMVYKPYLIMQYGTTNAKAIKKKDSDRIDDILSKGPLSDKRQEIVKREVNSFDNNMMSPDSVPKRMAYVPLVFLANTILGVMLLLLCGAVILYQILFIALVLIAPVPLLIALIPRWQQTAINWALKTLHALLMKVGLALFITILFAVSAILYRASDTGDLGYLGMMLLQMICFIGMWVKRNDLFSVIATTTNHINSNSRDLTSSQSYSGRSRRFGGAGLGMLLMRRHRSRNAGTTGRATRGFPGPMGGGTSGPRGSGSGGPNRGNQTGRDHADDDIDDGPIHDRGEYQRARNRGNNGDSFDGIHAQRNADGVYNVTSMPEDGPRQSEGTERENGARQDTRTPAGIGSGRSDAASGSEGAGQAPGAGRSDATSGSEGAGQAPGADPSNGTRPRSGNEGTNRAAGNSQDRGARQGSGSSESTSRNNRSRQANNSPETFQAQRNADGVYNVTSLSERRNRSGGQNQSE